jgi:MOSC domain-containing protein YiiM
LTVETCAECRFDGAHYDRRDARRSLATMAVRWRWAAAGVDETVLATRPAPTVWSAAEYAGHAAVVVASLDELVRMMTTQRLGRLEVPAPTDAGSDDAPYTNAFAAGVDLLEEHAARLDARVADLDAAQWLTTVELGDEVVDADWIFRHAVHDSGHHLSDVARGLHALGHGAPRSEGQVAGLFASNGGVPKLAIESANVGYRGVDGDRQHSREHHGRVWQALCVWSADVVYRLQAEGHPVAIGNAGENVSIAGIDWSSLRPGSRLAIGDSVLAEVSAYAIPCKKNAGWFLEGDFNRMSHEREPGVSRLYASVLHDGTIARGDAVVVEP